MKVSFFTAKLMLVFSVLFLVACSNGRILKTYEGDVLAKEQLSVLTAPENIVVLSINEKAVKTYLLSDIEVNYGLKPGKNLVVFQYESVWGKVMRGDDTPRSEKIVSKPKEVLIDAKAGEQLNFRFKKADNVREARLLAAAFEAEVIDAQSNALSVSTELGVYEAGRKARENLESQAEAKQTGALPDTANLQALDALKVLWRSANAEEKKAFLVWAFQK